MANTRETLDQRSRSVAQSIKEIDIPWITAGLGCDGDTIAMTARCQVSPIKIHAIHESTPRISIVFPRGNDLR